MEVGIARWLTPTNPSPRSMHSSTLLRGQVDFCNKYMSSLWLMWVHGYTHSSFHFASLYYIAQLSPVSCTHYLPSSKQPPYLPIMAFHSHSEIYFHATFHRSVYYDTLHHCHIALLHDHVVDIVFVAKPPSQFSYMSLLIHCISRYTAGGIHIESYFVLSVEL